MVATLNPRDEVIIPKPFWVSYPDIVKLAGGTPITIETSRNRNFKITADDLEKNITKNTKWIIINSPSNPTGEVYSSEELKSLVSVLKKYPNIYILSDDIYEHLLYEKKEKFTTIGEIDDEINSRTLTMNGVSKPYSMTGWRIGYCGGPKKIIDSMRKLQGQSTSNPSSISQWAAVEALNGDQSFLKDWLDSFEMRRNKVVEMINSAKGLSCLKPKGAFYAIAQLPVDDADKFAQWLLEDFSLDGETVMVAPASGFYATPNTGSNQVRIAYVLNEESLKSSIRILEEALKVYPGKTI